MPGARFAFALILAMLAFGGTARAAACPEEMQAKIMKPWTTKPCGARLEAGLKQFRAPACPFEVADSLAAIALRGGKGGPPTCLALLRGKVAPGFAFAQSDMNKPATALCPAVAVVTPQRRRILSVRPAPEGSAGRLSSDPLADTSNCCNLGKLAWAPGRGQGRVRVTGIGRDCFGGTAQIGLDAIYEWRGEDLRLWQDNSIGYH